MELTIRTMETRLFGKNAKAYVGVSAAWVIGGEQTILTARHPRALKKVIKRLFPGGEVDVTKFKPTFVFRNTEETKA